jgi:exopolysaccharide production protein ExoQ
MAAFAEGVSIDQSASMLSAIVGFIFAFRISLTFLWFQSDAASGSAVVVALSVGLLLCAFGYWAINSQLRLSTYPRPITWIGIYLVLTAFSLLWTTTQSILSAVGYWIAMAADVGTVMLMLSDRVMARSRQMMQGFIIGTAVVAFIAWSAPTMADLRLGDEDFLHPNALGFNLAIATLFAIYLASYHKAWKWLAAGLAFTLVRTLSKASIMAFLAASLYYLLRGSRISHKAKIKIGIAASLALAYFWTLLEAYADLYTQGSQAETLTGRTVIWAESFSIAMEKPWLGHGFYSFRWVVPLFGDFEAWQAHNEFLQQFFAYGIVGVFLVLALYWVFYRQVRVTPNCGLKTLATALLIFALVRGIVDTDRFDLSYPLWLMAMLSISLSSVDPARPRRS